MSNADMNKFLGLEQNDNEVNNDNRIVQDITVRLLIHILMEENMDDLVIVKKDGIQLHNVDFVVVHTKEVKKYEALFG